MADPKADTLAAFAPLIVALLLGVAGCFSLFAAATEPPPPIPPPVAVTPLAYPPVSVGKTPDPIPLGFVSVATPKPTFIRNSCNTIRLAELGLTAARCPPPPPPDAYYAMGR